ncbi:MAG TPA: spermidine/putrescine ABC transporter substrate-binding protein [Chloroflexi bacterium]|nr:spermidine/putrescine ABC transporter substrate-binding protein [Chloroflexota bacterium]
MRQRLGLRSNRQGFWLTAVFLLIVLVLVACGGGAPAEEGGEEAPAEGAEEEAAPTKIVISNWDAYMPEDLLDNFTAETGIEVELALHATNEEIVGKLVASGGRGFDVVFVTGQFAQALNNQGLLAEINHDLIPNMANLYPEVSEIAFDPGNTFSVPYTWGTTGLCYRTDLVDFEPTSWFDLLRPPEELVGKITMLQTDRWLLLPAQKALGFSANTTDPEEMAQVRDLLIEAKQNLLAYDDTTFYSRLVSGEAYLVEAWDGWCNYGIAENPDIAFVVPEEGSDLWVDTMVIPAASENQEAAHAFINYVLRPEVASWVVENILYKVPNQVAMEQIDPTLIETFPNLGMSPEELLAQEALLDVGEAQELYTEIVTEVLASE